MSFEQKRYIDVHVELQYLLSIDLLQRLTSIMLILRLFANHVTIYN